MADVFISYSRENQVLVRQLAEAVKREGYCVWWDDELPPHRSYGDVITEQIGAAKAAIVVWSQKAAASEWVRAEADVARNQKKLIQVSIDDRMPPLPFNQLHFVSIGDWNGEADHPGWRKVKESLAALCGPGAASPAAYPMPATPPPAAPIAAPPESNTGRRLLVAVIALSLLAILAVAVLAWMRPEAPRAASPAAPVPDGPAIRLGPPPAAADQKRPAPMPVAKSPEAPAPSRPREKAPERARAPVEAAPVNPRAARRYCMGRGRGTPECAALRRQYQGY